MNIEKAEKLFCDNATIGFGNDSFMMGFASGEHMTVYAFTPAHLKRFQQYLAYRVAEFEKANGEIITEPWSPDIKSPIQVKPKQAS
ncbi:hypothetical protein A3C89_00065 [Candidatus Kaiserbacteria bacterium RIFCSPHIGHO2_02_FULL_50_50]|uniref:Uncharacterized protein n=1 Tax=Candidatus Kaiserbacteria bacterium RIFCSPHIGHO2_02_FULL_50_50 TaxID=1798492 RepID=A0A1F6DGQ5_9BACT|nr:MAG: hypothetical protein A3C89_00065 [Candidatus Kaiserbacteria bacterium RIFCSPHIGHO2_02_FULL_50_50]OGG88207.1 MAG: hypothetical protein A3G62_00435 [Candidatus Kaiserbacteria bacterium RIFCSPLOWO2_12_FULL_50_10]